AVLAHPTWIKDDGDGLRGCVTALKEAGLDGVEAHYSTHSKSQTSRYLELAQRLNLLVTGGSDFHGITKPDIEVGYGRGDLKVNPRLLEPLKSVAAGRVSRLLARSSTILQAQSPHISLNSLTLGRRPLD